MTDSPAKKLNFSSVDKENVYRPIVGIPDLDEVEEVTDKKPTAVATIKPEEAYEPLLTENPQRFVLFPIKYHDVSQSTSLTRFQTRHTPISRTLTDFTLPGLAILQEGRSFLLDRRGDRSI